MHSRRNRGRNRAGLAVIAPVIAHLALGCDEPPAPIVPPDVVTPGGPAADCDPGVKTIHRLNRTEYDLTTRDLLGVDARLAQGFPADDVGYGFDNVADVLSTSPLLVEKLDAAAETLAEITLSGGDGLIETFEAEVLGSTVGAVGDGEWNLYSNGQIVANVDLGDDTSSLTLRVRAREQHAGDALAHMVLRFDGVDVAAYDVAAEPAVYEAVVEDVAAGTHTFAVAFTNDFYQPDQGLDRNLLVDFLEIETAATGSSLTRERIVSCSDETDACARAVFEAFLARAYRRPATTEEVEGLVDIVALAQAEGETFNEGLQLALHAALLSPSFLYRVELDEDVDSDAPHALGAYELASRLSYFLWSSMPDDALFAKAADGSLLDPTVMLAEVERMLEDDRSRALTQALAGQWLQARSLADAQPNPDRYPEMGDAMKASMRGETERFVNAFLRDDTRTLGDMLDAEFTFADEALATWYGLEYDPSDVDELGYARISTAGTPRGGLLTQAAFLTSTSYPLRTSPVKRGKWVLEQLICLPPDPPPPEVIGQFNEDESAGTVRERLEQHRANPDCAACHTMMDPIGFGLERFDPVGQFRDTDNGDPINDSDVFLTGDFFTGPRELAAILKEMPELQSCAAQHISTFATGSGVSPLEERGSCTIADVSERASKEGGSLGDVIRAVVTSNAFTKRRGGG